MKTLKTSLIAFFLVGGLSVPALAAEIGFDEIWGRVSRNAPSLRAAQNESEAAQIAEDRAARHWYPRVYSTMRAFSSNDPAVSFMGNLEQRQIGTSDFAPSALNDPGTGFFEQASIGVDLPLYEGGARTAQAEAAEKAAQARSWQAKAVRIEEYASVAGDYATLLVLLDQRTKLLDLRESVAALAKNYTIGAKSNPVGYSGLLGLKNVRNRLEGLLIENESRFDASRGRIGALAGELPEAWQPKPDRSIKFLQAVFPEGTESSESLKEGPAAAVQAARFGAEAVERMKSVERARFLPRVGLFAQGDLFAGSRSSATSATTGAYLQWDLFSAPNFGSVEQASRQSAAAEARARALENKMNGDRLGAIAGARAAEKNIRLLDESAALLAEQTGIARTLFRNGSINALQMAEVFNRHADLLVQRAEAELALAKLKAAIHLTTAREGVRHENAK